MSIPSEPEGLEFDISHPIHSFELYLKHLSRVQQKRRLSGSLQFLPKFSLQYKHTQHGVSVTIQDGADSVHVCFDAVSLIYCSKKLLVLSVITTTCERNLTDGTNRLYFPLNSGR